MSFGRDEEKGHYLNGRVNVGDFYPRHVVSRMEISSVGVIVIDSKISLFSQEDEASEQHNDDHYKEQKDCQHQRRLRERGSKWVVSGEEEKRGKVRRV